MRYHDLFQESRVYLGKYLWPSGRIPDALFIYAVNRYVDGVEIIPGVYKRFPSLYKLCTAKSCNANLTNA